MGVEQLKELKRLQKENERLRPKPRHRWTKGKSCTNFLGPLK